MAVKQSDYMHELKESLITRMPPDELADILRDYESFFAAGREEGRSEEDIARELGSPAFLARTLLAELEPSLLQPPIPQPVSRPVSPSVQPDQHLARPGVRICAFAIDVLIAVLPASLVAFIVGLAALPFLLIVAGPSPLAGASLYLGFHAFTVMDSVGVAVSQGVSQTIHSTGIMMEEVGRQNYQEMFQTVNRLSPLPRYLPIIALLFYLLYAPVCTLLLRGQTLGKRLMRIQVRQNDNQIARRSALFFREFLGKLLLNSIPIVPLISLFTLLLTKEHKTLHDMLADTTVTEE
jgi:uncharacterized membrane protein